MYHNPYIIKCNRCGRSTSKKYAREHGALCKECFTGMPSLYICPDCGERTLTPYQKLHGYHCDRCIRETDPQGYINEVRGLND